jgi:hypothetical protein
MASDIYAQFLKPGRLQMCAKEAFICRKVRLRFEVNW